MEYDIKSSTQRQQYNMLNNCYNVCKGRDTCDLYAASSERDTKLCVWYEILKEDKKILLDNSSKKILTFPMLEIILNNENNNI